MRYAPAEAPVHDPLADGGSFSLLGGRVVMTGTGSGDRPSLDAVLLAAAAPAAPGSRMLDVGCGSGAVGLCVAARRPDLAVVGVECSETAAAEGQANIAANGWGDRFEIRLADLARYKCPTGFDLVLSNPPFHDPASSRATDAARDLARFGRMPLEAWLRHCLRLCRPRGRLVVILRADRLVQALSALEGRAGDVRILPVHPRQGDPAIRVLVHARKAVRTPGQVLAGLVLHDGADGNWTAAARRVLEEAAAIEWERGEVVG
jgi:tRNA1(Val) A37 N6-methylase TrmN6